LCSSHIDCACFYFLRFGCGFKIFSWLFSHIGTIVCVGATIFALVLTLVLIFSHSVAVISCKSCYLPHVVNFTALLMSCIGATTFLALVFGSCCVGMLFFPRRYATLLILMFGSSHVSPLFFLHKCSTLFMLVLGSLCASANVTLVLVLPLSCSCYFSSHANATIPLVLVL
jgi:hypothetical protein